MSDERLARVGGLARQMAGLLATAEALLQAGRAVDLAGLDQTCGRLCALALDLAPEQGQAIRPELMELLLRLDALGEALGRSAPT